MSAIEDFIAASNSAASIEELFSILCATLAILGVESCAYFLVNDHKSMGLRGRSCVFSSYPEAWMNHYVDFNLLRQDPLLQFCFSAPSAFSWRQLNASDLPRASMEFVDSINNFGIADAIGVPIRGPNSELACLGLASPAAFDVDQNFFSRVQAIGVQFHTVFCRLAGKYDPVLWTAHLTGREREILSWSAEGKSVYAIGEILNLSENTVKYHLKNIYRKLGVADRIQAVIKAMFLGLIDPPRVSIQAPRALPE